jgi:hypothetical protein
LIDVKAGTSRKADGNGPNERNPTGPVTWAPSGYSCTYCTQKVRGELDRLMVSDGDFWGNMLLITWRVKEIKGLEQESSLENASTGSVDRLMAA